MVYRNSVALSCNQVAQTVGLSTLLQSKTNADEDGCIGCSQVRAKAEYKSSVASLCAHT